MAFNPKNLPTELWDIILHKVAVDERTDLYPFLFVCRRLHSLAIPILYESIDTSLEYEEDWDLPPSLKASPHLALTKQFSLFSSLLQHPQFALPQILESMTNIEKLCLEIACPAPRILYSIRSSTITHYNFFMPISCDDLRDALVAQTSLEYLKLSYAPEDLKLPADAMPNLRTLIVDPPFWDLFAAGRSIQHLEGQFLLTGTHLDMEDFLPSVLSLKVKGINLRYFRDIIPFLESIEYLCLTVNTVPTINDFLAIPSKCLRYCNLGSLSVSTAESRRMFDKFPQLIAFDASSNLPEMPYLIARYYRHNQSSPIFTYFPRAEGWEQWWEAVQDDLVEDAGSLALPPPSPAERTDMALFTLSDMEVHRVIDEEISKYRELIRVLSARRNAHNAMSKLPNEILSRILVEYKIILDAELLEKGTKDNGATRDYFAKLMNATCICSRWRQVALNTASFWSTLPLDTPSLVVDAFKRSKQSPLTIFGPLGRLCPRESPDGLLYTVMNATSRFQDVHIRFDVGDIYRTAIPRFLFPTIPEESRLEVPLLQTLKLDYDLSYRSYYSESDDGYDDEPDFNPRTMPFPWAKPTSLRSLALQNLVPVALPCLPCLTHLVIGVNDHVHNHCLSVPRIVDVLRNTPVLESITLSNVSSDDSAITPPAPTSPPIHLPNLRELHMTSIYLQESVLFAYLDTPALRLSKISFQNEDDDPGIQASGDISHLRHQISQSFPQDVNAFRVVMRMASRTPPASTYGDVSGLKLTVRQDKHPPQVIFDLDIPHFPLSAQCIGIFQSLPLGRITNLTLERVDGDDEALAWSRIIPHLIRLRYLVVGEFKVISVLATVPDSSLPEAINSIDGLAVNGVFNPELESITLEYVSLSAENLQTLKAMCGFRWEERRPLKHMGLECFVGTGRKAYESELKDYGTWVEWVDICDSESYGYEDEYDENYYPIYLPPLPMSD
ncbi:hypothetical protein ONZ45_g11962 [Pleurotus djamor]|nr:hypothetical protein ONZ45_g11962 [Pleurotus djamor]